MSHDVLFERRFPRYAPLILSGSMDDLSSWLAWFIVSLCRQRHASGDSFCFSPPTGGTPARLYEMLSTSMLGDLPFDSNDRFLALDNYHLPPDHPQGYDTEITKVLQSWNVDPNQLIRLPYRADLDEQRSALVDFDRELEDISVDVQGLGIGDDGHVAFRLRPKQLIAREALVDIGTELVELDATVRAANARFFGDVFDHVPQHALTRGFRSILAADWIWILANNIVKANPIYTAVNGAVGPHCPASYLQLHPRVLVLVAEEAAGPFIGDHRVRHRFPSIEDLLSTTSCEEYLQKF